MISKKLNLKAIKQGRSVYALNSLWMIFDRVINIVSVFVWSILLARSLGINGFGNYNAITSCIALLLPIAAFGLNGLLNKLILEKKKDLSTIILSGLILKLLAGVVCILLACLWFHYSKTLELNRINFTYSCILILFSLQVFESLNQAFSSSQVISLCRFFTVSFFLCVKIYFWMYDLLTLNIALILQACEYLAYFACIAYWSMSKYKNSFASSEDITFYRVIQTSKVMITGGGLLILSGVAETINLRVDVLMLTELSSLDSVSIYSVATKFSESGYFFAAAIATSFFPKIMESKRVDESAYYNDLNGLVKKLNYVCVVIFAITIIFAYPAIYYLYGHEYKDAYFVLLIHLFASFFVYFRAVFSKWLIVEHLFKYSLLTHLIGGVVNVLLNIILIPTYNYYGAAIATIISYAFSSYFSLLFFKKTRSYLTNINFNIFWWLVK